MKLTALLTQLKTQPETTEFADVIATIEANYDYQPAAFKNGETFNAAGENGGSCKIFAFAQLQQLSPSETLHCFGDYYRKDVLENPEGSDHANIRNFIRFGWEGIAFESNALTEK